MKLREIQIENFGIFSDKTLTFDEGGFQLIAGPNEAGKSTLLNLIRHALFGFPKNTPYAFRQLPHSEEIAATTLIELADGRQVRFRRRKGNKNTVVGKFVGGEGNGTNAGAIDESRLASLLDGANEDLFKNVFGFSLAELAAGEESLKQTNLNEALHGGGMGGLANFQTAKSMIQSECDELFSPRAHKRIINLLLAEIRAQKKEIKQKEVDPRDYEKWCADLAEQKASIESIREKRELLQGKLAHVKRLCEALTPFFQLTKAKEQHATLEVPAGFSANAVAEFDKAKQRLDEIQKELHEAEKEEANAKSKLANIQLDPKILDAEADIRSLQKSVEKIRDCLKDIPECRQESETIKERVLRLIHRLNPSWTFDQLEQFQTSLAQREEIEKRGKELSKLEHSCDSWREKRAELVEEMETEQRELEALGTVPSVDALEQLLDDATDYGTDCKRLKEVEEGLQQLDATEKDLAFQLNATLKQQKGAIEHLDRLPTPAEQQVQEFREQLAAAQEGVANAEERLERSCEEQNEAKDSLAQFDETTQVPAREQLIEQRTQRDAGWLLIRQKLLDDKDHREAIMQWIAKTSETTADKTALEDESSDLKKPLADLYETTVANADTLADLRQEKAEFVAKREQLVVAVGKAEKRRARAEARLDQKKKTLEQVTAEWQALWSHCGFEPLSPSTMLDWLQTHKEFLKNARQQQEYRSEREKLAETVLAFEEALHQALLAVEDASQTHPTPKAMLRAAKAVVKKTKELSGQRKYYEKELPRKKKKLAKLDRDIEQNAQDLKAWVEQWKAMLQEFGFPEDWDIAIAEKVLAGLADARTENEKAVSLDSRVKKMEVPSAEYAEKVAELCEKVAPDLAGYAAPDAVNTLSERLNQAHQARQDHELLTGQQKAAQQRIAKWNPQIVEIQSQLTDLYAMAGVKSEEEFHKIAERARERAEIAKEISGLERELTGIIGTEDTATFYAELKKADADTLAMEQQRAEEEGKAIEQTYRKAVEQAAIIQNQLQKLSGESEAATCASNLESSRGELVTAVDRWAPLVLAQALMQQAIQRFEREHQPAMLQNIERLFAKMTLDRYVEVRREFDQQGTLLLTQNDGTKKEPSQLSTGTREQLYLAIRLAYIQHYCRQFEPLPLVMDDVLVNFDDDRAHSTLKVLLEISNEVQVIFLTCHNTTVQRVIQERPQLQPLQLNHL
ncbi:MAG: AAA family ATPase [Deltaproteobacteria bacterium]|nr:AAA family ATPase [Deltaproteobacteria bacterium]